MAARTEPELEIRFFDRFGHYLPVLPLEAEAAKARALIGRRVIKRTSPGHYLVDTSNGEEPYYDVDVVEMRCTCPPVRLHKVQVCKHMILCQWIEDASHN